MKTLILFFALLISIMTFAPTQATAAISLGISPVTTTVPPAQKNVKKSFIFQKINKLVGNDMVLLIAMAILIPPFAVLLKEQRTSANFWIAVLLWFLGLLPGIIFALIIVLRD